MSASRVPITRPPRRQVVATQRYMRTALGEAQEGRDLQQVVATLAGSHPEDVNGLAALLTELGVATPSDMLDLVRMLVLSSGYTAVTWAGGLATEGGGHYSDKDVLGAAWATVEYHDEVVVEDRDTPLPDSASRQDR